MIVLYLILLFFVFDADCVHGLSITDMSIKSRNDKFITADIVVDELIVLKNFCFIIDDKKDVIRVYSSNNGLRIISEDFKNNIIRFFKYRKVPYKSNINHKINWKIIGYKIIEKNYFIKAFVTIRFNDSIEVDVCVIKNKDEFKVLWPQNNKDSVIEIIGFLKDEIENILIERYETVMEENS